MTCSVFWMLELHFDVLILCRIKDSIIIYDGILNENVVLGIIYWEPQISNGKCHIA